MVVRRDAINRCTKARDSLVADGVRRALADALSGGMTADELRELFEAELDRQSAEFEKVKLNTGNGSS